MCFMTISACIIGKNEETHLGHCLESIKPYVDEIIFVDTGSTDKTKAIANNYNGHIIEEVFSKDFSRPRNLALNRASKDWILVIDCDEVIDGKYLLDLTASLEHRGYVGCTFKLINIIDNKGYEGPGALRLFKNHEGFHYEGRIHEQILNSIYTKYSEKDIFISDIPLYHYGYGLDPKTMAEKHKRNLEIYKSYKDHEKDGFYYFNFANEAFANGDFEEALKNYEKALLAENNQVNFKEFIPANLLRCYYELKLFNNGLEVSNNLLEDFPYLRDIHFLRGSFFIALKSFSKGKAELEKYKAMKILPLSSSDKYFDGLNDIEGLIDFCHRNMNNNNPLEGFK